MYIRIFLKVLEIYGEISKKKKNIFNVFKILIVKIVMYNLNVF